jgi:hypothetical protein
MPEPLNLLELKPMRNVSWETGNDELATLIYPKFRSPFLQKYLVPWLAKPSFRIKLDAYGSFIWQRCDGAPDVAIIAEEMLAKFGSHVEPVYERIGLFLRKLESDQFIKFSN